MFELVLSVLAGGLSVSIVWLLAIMKTENDKIAQRIASIKRISETEKTIEAIEDLAKSEGLEQALADELNR